MKRDHNIDSDTKNVINPGNSVCTLAGGCRGNALSISGAGPSILIEGRVVRKGNPATIDSRELSPDHLTAVVVSHEHNDHIQSAGILAVIENPDVIKKILKHLGSWHVKRKSSPPAHAPPVHTIPIFDDFSIAISILVPMAGFTTRRPECAAPSAHGRRGRGWLRYRRFCWGR